MNFIKQDIENLNEELEKIKNKTTSESVISDMREELKNIVEEKLETHSNNMFNEIEEIKNTTEKLQTTIMTEIMDSLEDKIKDIVKKQIKKNNIKQQMNTQTETITEETKLEEP